MKQLPIIKRNRQEMDKLLANIEKLQSVINVTKAAIANAGEREKALREKDNVMRDAHRIIGRH